MELKTKGFITSLSIKGGEVRISIEIGAENISVDELKRMIDNSIVITLDDEQAQLGA